MKYSLEGNKSFITMSASYSLSLLGFAPLERQTLEALFKMASRRTVAYQVTADLQQAQLLLVNADSADAMQWLRASVSTKYLVLVVAKPGVTTQWPTLPRPIKLISVLEQLDILVRGRNTPVAAPAVAAVAAVAAVVPAVAAPSVRPASPVAQRRVESVRVGTGASSKFHNSADGNSGFMGLAPSGESRKKQPDSFFDDILVVDDSDIALKFMQQRLNRFGFRAELVSSGEEALTRVADKTFKFVFMDVMMQGLDGYQTCRAIKQKKHAGGKAPIVVMLTSRGGSIDKIRGSLAGCDAYLTKPLDEANLLAVLSKYDVQVERSFKSTNIGVSNFDSR